jgi:HAD superfamily hydrolase (TIGR01509 family)
MHHPQFLLTLPDGYISFMITAIIFDMDGVLVDSEPFHMQIERRQFELNGLSVPEQEHLSFMGTASELMWRKIREKYHTALTEQELLEQNRAESIRFFSELEHIPVMAGLPELLEKLRSKNYPMAVASSSFPEVIELLLRKSNLRNYFQVVVSGEEAGKSKPAPDIFLLAAQKLGVSSGQCLVVEDSRNGIKAARSAGMFCVAYQGGSANPEQHQEADAAISSYSQLELFLHA